MINTVRNTVLSVLNKNNYGYLSPSDFNLFAKQAQLEVFESYFYDYNNQINKENLRILTPNRGSGTGIADIKKGIEEAIDVFSVTRGLTVDSNNKYFLPSQTTTGDDYYLLNKVLVYKDIVTTGTTTAFDAANNLLIDSGATFTTQTIAAGDIVAVENGGVQYVTVVSVDSDTQITVTGTQFDASGLSYAIYQASTQQNEAEKVSHSKITMLNNSIYTSPNLTYPVYTQEDTLLTAFPSTVDDVGRVVAQYFRYPRDPQWTYIELSSGEPVFNQSSADYQDFEVPLEDEATLILKILQYAGVSIRESDVYQFGNSEELQDIQEQQ
jgi:hypothetical protein